MEQSKCNEDSNVLNISDRKKFLRAMKQRFLNKIRNKPYFLLTSTPEAFHKTKIDVQKEEILELLKNPLSYKRDSGWTVDVIGNFVPTQTGIENDDYSWRHLILLRNGHLEFWAKIDESFCWRQNEQEIKTHPRLYPYAVVEYPVSFFYLLRDLVKLIGIDSKILITGGYFNCKGCFLRPGHPNSIIFRDYRLYKSKYWEEESPIEFAETLINSDFNPDSIAYDVVLETYNAFGIEAKYIPFVDENKKFKIT